MEVLPWMELLCVMQNDARNGLLGHWERTKVVYSQVEAGDFDLWNGKDPFKSLRFPVSNRESVAVRERHRSVGYVCGIQFCVAGVIE